MRQNIITDRGCNSYGEMKKITSNSGHGKLLRTDFRIDNGRKKKTKKNSDISNGCKTLKELQFNHVLISLSGECKYLRNVSWPRDDFQPNRITLLTKNIKKTTSSMRQSDEIRYPSRPPGIALTNGLKFLTGKSLTKRRWGKEKENRTSHYSKTDMFRI